MYQVLPLSNPEIGSHSRAPQASSSYWLEVEHETPNLNEGGPS